jgi:hypothetical protein
VLAALAKNPTAWKECARWKYVIAVLSSRRMEKESAEMMEKESAEMMEKESVETMEKSVETTEKEQSA